MKIFAWAASLFVAFILVLFCVLLAPGQVANTPLPKKDMAVYAELGKVPEKARSRQNPFEKDADAIVAGRNLFERHCAECHGDSAEGKKGPNLRVPEVQNVTPGTLFWLLTNGVVRKGMPVWSKLPEPQRWQLVAYIKSLGVVASGYSNSKTATPSSTSGSSAPPR